MEFVMVLLAVLTVVLPIVVILVVLSLSGKVRRVESEIERLQGEVRGLKRALARPESPPAPAAVPAPAQAAAPAAPPARPAPTPAAPPPVPPARPAVLEPAPAAPEPAPAAPRRLTAESIIGGLWLQNVGSVLVLLGVFFLIFWGYTTGRLGPGALVAAAIAAGAIVAWRGDRMARSLPGLGHALVGVGLGIAYLALYLGHYLLHVLSAPAAYTSLAVVSLIALRLGRHYRVQAIEALAVLGAFVPFIAPVLAGTEAVAMTPAGLLAYLALVNLAVLALSVGEGFGGLALEALLLTTVAWLTAVGDRAWGWWTTGGLALLFLGFGHAGLPRIARTEDRVHRADALVVVLAPFLFFLAALPFLARLTPHAGGWLLAALAGVELAAASWLDPRRKSRDVWHGLVTVAVVYLTAALERLLGTRLTPMVWTVEGVAILAAGFMSGSSWVRTLGWLVSVLGVFVSAVRVGGSLLVPPYHPELGIPALFTADSVRGLVEMLALFEGERLVRAQRDRLEADEGRTIEVAWGAVAQLLLFAWIGRHALRAAAVLVTHEQLAQALGAGAGAAGGTARTIWIGSSLAAAGWMAQATWHLLTGMRRSDGVQRVYGYISAFAAGAAFLAAGAHAATSAAWAPGDWPFLHPAGLAQAFTLALGVWLASRLHRERSALPEGETRLPDLLTVATNALILLWSGQQAGRLAAYLAAEPSVHLGAVLTSAAWILQAVILVALGLRGASSLLRWTGLAILGVTLLKVLFLDLSEVGVFWRFVVAIGFGVVLMIVSYAYQRSQRHAARPPA